MAALGPDPDPLKVLSIAADKIKLMPFSFLDTLADLACQTSPIKIKNGGRNTYSDDMSIGTTTSRKRPRAYSESWAGHSVTAWTNKDFEVLKAEGTDGSTLLPQMLDHYAEIYNKNGRIGIYNREERDTIIERFRAKKRRRVWKKKIRYHCRKNLADRRVRVKGRFVRRGSEGATDAEEVAPSPSADGSLEGEEDDLEDEDTDGENDPGPTEEEPSTSSSASSSSAKRSRIYDKAGEKKQKKPKRVLFDESVVDNSDNTSTAVSSTTGSGGNSSASSLQEDGDNLNLVGGQRMRRHSIAY